MLRRSGSERPTKVQRGGPKARKAATSHASTGDLQDQIAALSRELKEAREQQAATSDVLRVISSSPTELLSVLDMVGEDAARLCDANNAVIFRLEGDILRQVASYGGIPTTSHPSDGLPANRDTVSGRAVCDRRTIHVHDLASEDHEYPLGSRHAKSDGHRTTLATPLLREGAPIGVILIRRMEVRPFSDRQIALLETFANQAVIAIENVRLFNETKETLEQQTATSEVLRVISSSPTDLAPVFETILGTATRLCEGNLAALWRYDGKRLVGAAQYNASPAFVSRYMGAVLEPSRQGPARLAALERRTVHVADITVEPGFSPQVLQYERARTVLAVPLLREKDLVGVIAMWRREVRPFSNKQIELVQGFAAQAVIAIENVGLFDAEQQRTRELSESLEQQTATSEVLKVISSSPGKLEPVFLAMLENAVRICSAKFGHLWLREGDAFRIGATYGAPPAFVDYLRTEQVFRPDPRTGLGQMLRTKDVYQLADITAVPTLGDKLREATIDLAGARTLIGVPMLKDNEVIGAIVIYRQEVLPFTDKRIELVKNFAAQAVIAIENTRLLNELRESLQQQTATADVLRIISSSPGDLKPVFDPIVSNAQRICGARFGNLLLFDGKYMRVVAMHNAAPEHVAMRQRDPIVPLEKSILRPLVRSKRLVHVADIAGEEPYASSALAKVGGMRTALAVPMLRDDELVGAIGIYNNEVR